MSQNSTHNPRSLRCVLLFQVSSTSVGVCIDAVVGHLNLRLLNLILDLKTIGSVLSQLCPKGRLFVLYFVEFG
jgi:hypothetical protein